MLVRDEIGDVPGQAIECFSSKAEGFVSGDSWFHDRRDLLERRSLHGWSDSRKASRDVKRDFGRSRCRPVFLVCLLSDGIDRIGQRDRTDHGLKLRRNNLVGDDNDPMHDGMDSAEIGVATWSESWHRKTTVRQDKSGVEGASGWFFQTVYMSDGVFGRGGVFPSDWSTAGDGGGLRDEIG